MPNLTERICAIERKKMYELRSLQSGSLFAIFLIKYILRFTEAISCYSCNEFPGESYEDCEGNTTLVNFGERKDVGCRKIVQFYIKTFMTLRNVLVFV